MLSLSITIGLYLFSKFKILSLFVQHFSSVSASCLMFMYCLSLADSWLLAVFVLHFSASSTSFVSVMLQLIVYPNVVISGMPCKACPIPGGYKETTYFEFVVFYSDFTSTQMVIVGLLYVFSLMFLFFGSRK